MLGQKPPGFLIYPPPPSGDWADYGPLPSQRQFRPFTLPEHERPHLHYVDIAAIIGSTGSGKCFAEGTPILMYTGEVKTVESIKPGEEVMGPDSSPRLVKSVCSGREKMYRVSPVKGEPFVCNESHVLSLRYTTNHNRVLNVSVRDYLCLSRTQKRKLKLYRSTELTFPNSRKKLPIDPYFMGVWLGDGDERKTEICNPEPEITEFVKRYASKLSLRFVPRESPSYIGRCAHYSVSGVAGVAGSNPLLSKLKDLNLIENKHIPFQYLTASVEDRKLLLAGLLDTDGSLSGGGYDFIQKSKEVAEGLLHLCRGLGLAAYLEPCEKSCTVRGEKFTGKYFRISISGDCSNLPLKVARKKAPKRRQIKSVLVTGFDLECLGNGDYYGFQVAGPDHLFLLGDFTVVHNSDGAVASSAETLVAWPGSHMIMGAMNFPLLQRTSMEKLKNLFSENGADWGHKYVLRAPTQNDKRLRVKVSKNSRVSTGYFLNLENWETIKGIPGDSILIEELQSIKKEQMLDELVGRLRGVYSPYKQIMMLANPQLKGHWSFHRFKLQQYMANNNGPSMNVGKPCRCQFCHHCLKLPGAPEIEWKADNSCPSCLKSNYCRSCVIKYSKQVVFDKDHCPDCGFRRCPGDQDYHRVVFCYAEENIHNDATYTETMRGGMSAHQYKMLGQGQIIDSRQGRIYVSWTQENVLEEGLEAEINPDLPLIWSLDFNNDPMCSVIMQEYFDEENKSHNIAVLDEIVEFGYTPEDVAAKFIEKYPDWKGPIYIYGDPMGHVGGIKGKVKTRYEALCDVLRAKGYDYELRVPKTRYDIAPRVDTTDWHLQDVNGYIRIKFNERCKYTILSFEGLEWNTQGNKESELGDRQARESEDKGLPFIMSHPQAAVGYFLINEHPQVKWAEKSAWHMDPSGKVTELRDGEVIEYSLDDDQYKSLDEMTPDDLNIGQESVLYLPSEGAFAGDLSGIMRDHGGWFDNE